MSFEMEVCRKSVSEGFLPCKVNTSAGLEGSSPTLRLCKAVGQLFAVRISNFVAFSGVAKSEVGSFEQATIEDNAAIPVRIRNSLEGHEDFVKLIA